jgi:hypothetical protein
MNNDAGQVAAAFLVPSTKVGDIAHGVRQVSQRPHFKPKVIATDTWPKKESFWFGMFTTANTGMLGLFHFMQRITRTLRITNSSFYPALRDLKDCVYEHETEDYEKLIDVLQRGTISHSAQPLTHLQLQDLKRTVKWSQRYSRFLRKKILKPTMIKENLLNWVEKYKQCIDPISEQKLFVCTEKAVNNQIQHLAHIQWPKDINMYVRIPPGRRATHGLDSFRSRNPEPQLESFHAEFAHYGNNRMTDTVGDDIHLRGIASRNLRIQHEIDVREGLVDVSFLPVHLADIPLLQDHHLGQHINNVAISAGCTKEGLPFRNLKTLAFDTDEQFLAAYFHSQVERNASEATKPDPLTDFCKCCTAKLTEPQERPNDSPADIPPAKIAHQTPLAFLLPRESIHPTYQSAPPLLVPRHNTFDVLHRSILNAGSTSEHYDRQLCCKKYTEYNEHKRLTGKFKPGRVPHDRNCKCISNQRKNNGLT